MADDASIGRMKRWRLVLGEAADTADGADGLDERQRIMDRALTALYGGDGAAGSRGGLGKSAPRVARWLGDIREYFPSDVVRVMQKDALNRLGLRQMLTEPEMLEAVEPDVHLVANLISMSSVIPEKTKATARAVVRKVVDELLRKLQNPMQQAIVGSLNRSARNPRPRHNEIDWHRTIRANLRHYQAEYQTIVPHRRLGFGRKRSSLRDIVLLVDQSGSMASSVVYSSIFAAVMASIPAVSTSLILFDTSVVDMTEKLVDPVDVLFGAQLGGGTDIAQAVGYAQERIRRPSETIVILISDLMEGGHLPTLHKRLAAMVHGGTQLIALLALSDEGSPWYDGGNAAILASLNVPCFACTPNAFPDLMAAAINRRDVGRWAADNEIAIKRPGAKDAIEF